MVDLILGVGRYRRGKPSVWVEVVITVAILLVVLTLGKCGVWPGRS